MLNQITRRNKIKMRKKLIKLAKWYNKGLAGWIDIIKYVQTNFSHLDQSSQYKILEDILIYSTNLKTNNQPY